MGRTRILSFFTSALLFLSPPGVGFPPPRGVDPPPEFRARLCGTPSDHEHPVPPHGPMTGMNSPHGIAAGEPIPVNFHVIHDGAEGDIPEAWLDAQIEVLNRNYAGQDYDGHAVSGASNTGYRFFKNSVTRTDNRRWFTMSLGSRIESEAKSELVVDPTTSLNIYTCRPGHDLLGWAEFPWSLIAHPEEDGVVVHYGTLPGGDEAPYNLGGTVTHEVGHWLGLLHPFQGGCYPDESCLTAGDMVCDTPAEGVSTSGCPAGKNSCSGTGEDPIHNYMDYSTDVCYSSFTEGQDDRMDFMMGYYRPAIGAFEPQETVSGVGEPGRDGGGILYARPNPFGSMTTLHFALSREAHVSLRLYDLTGRLVSTLVEGRRPAGLHAVSFDGRGLSAGVYFYTLDDGETLRKDRLLYVR